MEIDNQIAFAWNILDDFKLSMNKKSMKQIITIFTFPLMSCHVLEIINFTMERVGVTNGYTNLLGLSTY